MIGFITTPNFECRTRITQEQIDAVAVFGKRLLDSLCAYFKKVAAWIKNLFRYTEGAFARARKISQWRVLSVFAEAFAVKEWSDQDRRRYWYWRDREMQLFRPSFKERLQRESRAEYSHHYDGAIVKDRQFTMWKIAHANMTEFRARIRAGSLNAG
jgi:hypothetical protein